MIWIILAVGLIFRLISLNQSLWLDEAISVLATKNYSLPAIITQYSIADFHPPGYLVILWFWTKVFGISEIAVRIPSVIFGVLTIYVIYLIGQKIHSKTLGLLSAVLLAINPLHIYYSQEARMYALVTLAVSANIFLFIKLLKGEKVNYFFLILSNFLVFMSDYLAYFIFPAQLVTIFLIRKIATHSTSLRVNFLAMTWMGCLLVAGMLSIWWLPTFLGQLDVGAVASANLPTWKFVVGAFDVKTIPLTFVKFIIGRISLANKITYAAVLLPVCILFAYLLLRGARHLADINRKLFLSWFIVPPVIATIISFFIPIYSYFRLLFVLPAFIILASLGIFSFKSKARYVFLTATGIIQIFSASVYLFNPSYQRDDWKGVVNFLKSQGEIFVLFESSGTLPPFDYYAKGRIIASGGLKDFPANDSEDVADLKNILQDSKNVYLIEYLVDISDPKRLVQKKLTELNYEQVEIKNFNGVGFIYHYFRK